MFATESVTPFTPRMAEDYKRQLRHSVYIEDAAEALYELAALCDRLPEDALPWHRLSQAEKAPYRYEATASLNRLSRPKRYEAQLRAREAVATSPYGPYHRDFSMLSEHQQTEIKFLVQTSVETYSRVLEGLFTTLPVFRAVELEPATTPQVEN